MSKNTSGHLLLVRSDGHVVDVHEDDLEPAVDEARRRGKLYDAVLASIRCYARKDDPNMTLDDVAGLMIDFPLFLAELQQNWSGSGFVREMPNVLGQKTYSR